MPLDDISDDRIGLRAYDIAIGFRNLEERSGAVSEYARTNATGMAALLAGAVKGRDVIKDASRLKLVAAEVLKISPYAFDSVVAELGDLDLVRNIQRRGGEVQSFTENVPLLYDDVHKRLGEHWRDKRPAELEQVLVSAVDKLAAAPSLSSELFGNHGLDTRSATRLRAVAENAELIRTYRLRDGSEVSTSPLFSFERPDRIADVFSRHPVDEIRSAFERIRRNPGTPVVLTQSRDALGDMVRTGLVAAPVVKGADAVDRAFIVVPYGLDPSLLTTKKSILERAMALIAVVRCGEISGGASAIRMPDRYLAALLDPARNYTLAGHSSTRRQYAALIKMGVIETVLKDGYWAAKLVPTQDNLEAVALARTLLARKGDALPERGNEQEAASLLFTGESYLAPIETISVARRVTPAFASAEVEAAWADALGH